MIWIETLVKLKSCLLCFAFFYQINNKLFRSNSRLLIFSLAEFILCASKTNLSAVWEECNSNNQLIKSTYSIIFYRPPLKKLRFLRYFIFSFYQADQASEVHSDSPRVVSGNLRQLQQQLSQLQLQDSDHYQGNITYFTQRVKLSH